MDDPSYSFAKQHAVSGQSDSTILSSHPSTPSVFSSAVFGGSSHVFNGTVGTTFNTTTVFAAHSGQTKIKPATDQGESALYLQAFRPADAAVNPNGEVFRLQQNGTITWFDSANNGTQLSGRIWIASGTGGLMSIITGSGNSGLRIRANRIYLESNANPNVEQVALTQSPASANKGKVQLNGTSGPFWISHAGTPEGAITAPVGSMYTRTDGGAGTTLYIKESGTGNTGWIAK